MTFSVTSYTANATRGIQYVGATGASASTSLATDKMPLLPGQSSTFANYTNYSRGLNGLVIDVVGLPASGNWLENCVTLVPKHPLPSMSQVQSGLTEWVSNCL